MNPEYYFVYWCKYFIIRYRNQIRIPLLFIIYHRFAARNVIIYDFELLELSERNLV